MHFVYILQSENTKNWTYVGSCSDLERRIKEHNSGKTISTKSYRPLKIVYKEEFETRAKAYERELFLKTTSGRREKMNLLKNIDKIS